MVPSLTRAIKLSDAVYLSPPIPAHGTCGTIGFDSMINVLTQLRQASPIPKSTPIT
ncbi:MAG: hypothetical protein QMC24_12825 [Akkermansiaceae bacterium]|jgi:hypothetical protein